MNTGDCERSGLDTKLKTIYWSVVEDCLVKFHHLPKGIAHAKSNAVRKKLKNSPPGINADFFYHTEPFYVACDLAGVHNIRDQERILEKHASEYDSIVQIRGW